MADNYEQFSEIIECHNAEQRDWLLEKLSFLEEVEDAFLCNYTAGGETQVLLYNEEWLDIESLANVLQEYLIKFDLDDQIILSISYSCSKPRPGEFGGYAMGITAERIETIEARDAMAELLTNGDR